ncbi:MAG: hypothetical protein V7L26_28060 [Nostoc sp.]|uniref:hypothetical protein n=1 Tax=Nostoc sp. TaxID=1180 RepID=UPI002FF45950
MLKSCDFRVALPKLLPLAGETLINAWQNQTNPTQALVYTAASIFNPNFVTNAQIAFGAAFDISKAEAHEFLLMMRLKFKAIACLL